MNLFRTVFELFALYVDAGNEGIEIGRVILAVHLGLEGAPVGGVLIFVDGVAHHPEVAMQFALVLALDLETCDGHGGRGQDGQNGYGDNQLNQGKTALGHPMDEDLSMGPRRRDTDCRSRYRS